MTESDFCGFLVQFYGILVEIPVKILIFKLNSLVIEFFCSNHLFKVNLEWIDWSLLSNLLVIIGQELISLMMLQNDLIVVFFILFWDIISHSNFAIFKLIYYVGVLLFLLFSW